MLLCDGNHILRGAVALDAAALSTLTPREAEVLRRITAGQNTKKMAGEMNVTTETLRTYVKKVLAKLGAHSRLEAATFASRHITQGRQELDHDQSLFAALTPREREVLAHLTKGSENREHAPAEPQGQTRRAFHPGSGRAGPGQASPAA
jgi:DNA-binding NarL/FixJ family response regulator